MASKSVFAGNVLVVQLYIHIFCILNSYIRTVTRFAADEHACLTEYKAACIGLGYNRLCSFKNTNIILLA